MPRSRPPYPPEFRQELIQLVRSGRTPESLSKEYEPSAQSLGYWVTKSIMEESRSCAVCW